MKSDTVNISGTLLPDWLKRCAENMPDHLAVKCGEIRWSFADLDQQATHLAYQLATIGIQKGSRVALLAANGLSYVACVHALTRLGAILVPLNTRLTRQELSWQLHDVRATLLLSDTHYAPIADELQQTVSDVSRATLVIDPTTGASLAGASLTTTDHQLRSLIDLEATQVIMYTSGTTGH